MFVVLRRRWINLKSRCREFHGEICLGFRYINCRQKRPRPIRCQQCRRILQSRALNWAITRLQRWSIRRTPLRRCTRRLWCPRLKRTRRTYSKWIISVTGTLAEVIIHLCQSGRQRASREHAAPWLHSGRIAVKAYRTWTILIVTSIIIRQGHQTKPR